MSGLFGEILPSKLKPEAWAAYCEWRDKMPKHKRWSPYARSLILKKLHEFESAGFDPTEIVHTSLENGWTGVFVPKRPAPFSAIPANDPKPAQADQTRAYIADLERHRAAATDERAQQARQKLKAIADQMRKQA